MCVCVCVLSSVDDYYLVNMFWEEMTDIIIFMLSWHLQTHLIVVVH